MGLSFVFTLRFGVKVIFTHTCFFSKFIGSCTNWSYGRSFLEGPALLATIVQWLVVIVGCVRGVNILGVN